MLPNSICASKLFNPTIYFPEIWYSYCLRSKLHIYRRYVFYINIILFYNCVFFFVICHSIVLWFIHCVYHSPLFLLKCHLFIVPSTISYSILFLFLLHFRQKGVNYLVLFSFSTKIFIILFINIQLHQVRLVCMNCVNSIGNEYDWVTYP